MVVVWSNSAKAELRKAYKYIALDSLKSAEMVKDALIEMSMNLPKHPQKYPVDRFKKNNDGSWKGYIGEKGEYFG